MLRDCPISTTDIANARAVFGPPRDIVRGRTVRRQPRPAVEQHVSVPPILRERNKVVTLGVDVFQVNRIPFFLT